MRQHGWDKFTLTFRRCWARLRHFGAEKRCSVHWQVCCRGAL